MKFEPMPRTDIARLVKEAYKTQNPYLVIILTDGMAFCGKLPSHYMDSRDVIRSLGYGKEANVEKESKKGYLIIENDQVSKEYLVYVPLDDIAGLSSFGFSQKYIEKKAGPLLWGQFHKGSAAESIFKDLINEASARLFETKKLHVAYRLAPYRSITWGEISFKVNTPLYCDWDFMNVTSGGLTSLGASFMVGFSAGWKKSLWSAFHKKVNAPRLNLDQLNSVQEATISGFVRFLKFPRSKSLKEEDSNLLDMEGEKWCSALITNREINTLKQIKDTIWAIGYFKQDAFMYPKNLWEKFSQEIRLYGEIVPANLNIEFGSRECFMKVRAAAFIK